MKSITSRAQILMLAATLPALFATTAGAATTSLAATGWTQDVFFSGPGPYGAAAVTGSLDNGPGTIDGYTYYESGSYMVYGGVGNITMQDLSTTGVKSSLYTSATAAGSGNTFQFQSFTAANTLLLNNGVSGTLTLATAAALSKLAIYGTTGGGTSAATLVFNFSTGAPSTYTIAAASGITRDWYSPLLPANPTPEQTAAYNLAQSEIAVRVGGRMSNRGEDAFANVYLQTNDRISIYESIINLTPADQLRELQSVTFTNDGGGHLGIMALSGQAVPEPSTLGLVAVCGLAGLARRRRA